MIADAIVKITGVSPRSLIQPVKDRLAHDRRYAIDSSKARRELGFVPGKSIEEQLPSVVEWYRANSGWWQRIKAGDYKKY